MLEENLNLPEEELRKKLQKLKVLREQIHEQKLGITDEDRRIREECESSLIAFAQHAWHILEPASRKMLVGWALEGMSEHLEAVEDGDITRLLMNVPPGSMKSLLTRVFYPAWVWGPKKCTWKRFLYASYDQKLSIRDAKKMRELISSKWYQRLWPHVRMTAYQAEKANFQNTDNGFVMSLSVGGRTTGERGDVVIIDDAHNVSEAESDIVRTGTVDWFKESIPTRVNDFDKSAIIVIMQRVHEDDVSGYILSNPDLGYVHLCIPLYYDAERHCTTRIGWTDPRTTEGENFWPERYIEAYVKELTKGMGPYAVACQMQQAPSPKGGGIIKKKFWLLWKEPYFPLMEYVLASADTAFTEDNMNDPSAVTVWGVYRDENDQPKIMLMYAWEGRFGLHELVKEIERICTKYKVDKLIVENKASGISVQQELRRLFTDASWGVELVNPEGDKTARLISVQHLFAGDVTGRKDKDGEYITTGGIVYAPDKTWADMVIDQVAKYPNSRHDDITDTVSQAMRFLRRNGLAVRRVEREVAREAAMAYQSQQAPLYDV